MVKRVLITDDALFIRVALKNILEKNGFVVVGEAENGFSAIEKYKLLKPDIVTLDITMPVMGGLDALKHIRAFDKNAKVLMISSMGQESVVREAVISGALGFLIKPFNEETIVKSLSKL
ncbi:MULTISPECIES: response regulator [Clostridium]|uniref:Response regulator n=1 Tax=Clostridium frigoriphilum TaxID=443253 RepID=A0ABU7UQF5_9CLOT|nr:MULTISPECIES: response regulator [Clostridium]MBU3074745.1 response regulator [Clostridium estertheticum]MBU3099465.1 response regulator [Clostridium sp. DSM 17811]MBU3164960.1 response regulator [Clostridium estertheticum]MBU3173894.1 response regulator [Clostridium estertheticum]